MTILITLIHVIVCFFLIAVVLLQSGKSGDLAAAFGGQGSQTAFGPRGAASVLSRATTWSAIIFMLTSITLSIFAARRKNRKRDRREHEDDRGPGCRPGKDRSCASRAKRRLAALSAKSRGQVAALSALQQNDCNQKKTNDNVNQCDQNGHCKKRSVGPGVRFQIPVQSI